MIVLLQWGQGAAPKGNGMVPSITVSGRAPLPVPPCRHPSPTEKACRSQGTPGWVWTGPFPSGCPQPPRLRGADPPDPSSPLSLACRTRVHYVGKPLDKPPVMPCQSTKCTDLRISLGHWEFLHSPHILPAR